MENQQPPTSLLSDLDQPFTDEELKAIDAAFEAVSSSSSTSSVKKLVSGDSPSDPRPKTRRRLPESVKESIRKTPLKENNLRSSSRLKWLKNLDLPSQQGNKLKDFFFINVIFSKLFNLKLLDYSRNGG